MEPNGSMASSNCTWDAQKFAAGHQQNIDRFVVRIFIFGFAHMSLIREDGVTVPAIIRAQVFPHEPLSSIPDTISLTFTAPRWISDITEATVPICILLACAPSVTLAILSVT